MRTPRNSSTASPPPFSQKHLDIEEDYAPHTDYESDDIEWGPVKKDIKIIDLLDSDSEDEAYEEDTVIEETTPVKKKRKTTPSQGHAEKKDPGPECSPTINTSSEANVVTPPITCRKRGDDDEENSKIPENYKFMGHWKNPPPEDMKKGKIYCTIRFNREPWSTKE